MKRMKSKAVASVAKEKDLFTRHSRKQGILFCLFIALAILAMM